MIAAIGIPALALFAFAVWLAAGCYLRDHHAKWLVRHDGEWESFSLREQNFFRIRGLPPSWEQTDEQLARFVGHRHARWFRDRGTLPPEA